jgi:hypothetical protein
MREVPQVMIRRPAGFPVDVVGSVGDGDIPSYYRRTPPEGRKP